MALSDSCFEFLEAISLAANALSKQAHEYSDPDYPIRYGQEVDAVKRAAFEVAERPYDAKAVSRLVTLALKTSRFHDTPPGSECYAEREIELKELVALFQKATSGEDAQAVEGAVAAITRDTVLTLGAARHLKELLPKLGKTSYEIAVKIIGDVGSAMAKKIMGL
jgi:hypothetical protein